LIICLNDADEPEQDFTTIITNDDWISAMYENLTKPRDEKIQESMDMGGMDSNRCVEQEISTARE